MINIIDPLISPQSSNLDNDWETPFLGMVKKPVFVGITGPTRSGKTILAKHLVTEHGFSYFNMTSVLLDKAKKLGWSSDWESLGKIARILREIEIDYIAKNLLRGIDIRMMDTYKIVVDNILHPAEIDFFDRTTSMTTIGIRVIGDIREKESFRWYGEDSKPEAITRRDGFEQYNCNNDDKFAPDIDGCLSLISEKNIIKVENEFSHKTLLDKIEVILSNIL